LTGLSFEDDLAAGEWLHNRLREVFGLESEEWATQRVRRVERQLQVKRAPRARLTPEILWTSGANAFAAPGRYIYITRELLQRAATDDPVAFILAHEMAHHDLGHLDPLAGRRRLLQHIPAGANIALLIRAAEWLLIGPEAEADADSYAFSLCLKAGYDGRKCLEAFDILEAEALAFRDIDIVFGPEESLVDSVQGVRSWVARAKRWGWQRARHYLPIRDRKERLLSQLGLSG
jgi:hypothetical protein